MKPKLFLLFFALCISAHADFRITTTITVTNLSTNGSSFTYNSDTRTGTNAISATTFATNSTAGGTATNLYNQFIFAPFTGVQRVEFSGTNEVKLISNLNTNVTVAIVGDWGYSTLTTQAVNAAMRPISVPASNYLNQATATNDFSQLASDLFTYNTNFFRGNFTNVTLFGTTTFGAGLTISDGEILASSIEMNGSGTISDNDNGDPVIDFANDLISATTLAGGTIRAVTLNASSSALTNSVLTNSTFYGTNLIGGDFSFSRSDNSALANGNNAAVDLGGKVYVKVSGPTGAFTINGIAGGRDGRRAVVQNSTGFTLTIANDSGTDPTASNRIYTGTGSDISITNNPGFVDLIYDSSVSRWGVISYSH